MGIELIRSIILVGAGKGGVGKSSMTCLLGHAFTKLGLDVGILDADLYGPSIPKMLGFDPSKETSYTDEAGQILPILLHRMKMVSLGLFQDARPAVVRAPVANSFIEQLLFNTAWGALDILLIDLPPGTSDIHLTILQKVKAACAAVVTSPQKISYQDAKKAAQMFVAMGVPIGAVIENFSGILNSFNEIAPLFLGDAGDALQKEFLIDLLAKIPLDPDLSNFLDIGINPLLKEGTLTKEILSLAEKLRDWMWVENPHPSNAVFYNFNDAIQK